MGLEERLMADLRDAMRSKDAVRKEAIRLLRAAVKNAEIEEQRSLSDSEIEDLVRRDIKRREEAIEMFEKGGREDLVTQEKAKIAVLEEYMPEQLSEDEIREVVNEIVDELGASGLSDLGPVMREAMARLRGQADGRLVNQVAREILAQSH